MAAPPSARAAARGAFFASRRRAATADGLAQYAAGTPRAPETGPEHEAVLDRRIVTGEVVRLHDSTQPDGAWVKGALASDDGSVEVPFVGADLPGCQVGCVVRLVGAWEQHAEYGLQFRAHQVETELPKGVTGISRYLQAHVRGCGPTRARALAQALGPEALELLAADPATAERLVGGKAGAALGEAVATWAQAYHSDRRAIALATKVLEAGGTVRMAGRIQRHFAEQTEDVLLHHPYRLVEVSGIGFKTADAIARTMGISERDPSRIAAGLVYALETRMEQGDSAVPREVLERTAMTALTPTSARPGAAPAVAGPDAATIATAVDRALDPKVGTLIEEDDLIFLPRTVALERFVASRVAMHREADRPLGAGDRARVAPVIAGSGLAPEQQRAVWMGLEHGISILTGRPGTGKTTTTRTFIRAATALGWSVALAAPTGKAASRASEVTGLPGKTIHRLIGGRLMQRRDTPLDVRVLILDETSMVDLELMAWVLDNVDPTRTSVICVGDHDQLPSVGHGRVLADLIESGVVPTVALRQIFRQAEGSRIIVNAHRLLDARPMLLDNARGSDFLFADVTDVRIGPDGFPVADDPGRSRREVAAARARLVKAIQYLAQAHGAVPLRDVQVLSPMRRGELGVESINPLLQDALNPHGTPGPAIGGGVRVRTGDRVLQTKNDYALGLFNGDQGEVISVDRTGARVSVRFDERVIEIEREGLSRLRLAWAMTVHRAQGSEFPFTLLLYHTSHHVMLDVPILYTAITRARRQFILIGTQRAVDLTVHQARRATPRHTGLAGRLRALCPPISLGAGATGGPPPGEQATGEQATGEQATGEQAGDAGPPAHAGRTPDTTPDTTPASA